MNKKGEREGINMGLLLLIFISVIAALAIYPAIVDNINSATVTITTRNQTFTTAGTANVSVGITGQELITLLNVRNRSGNVPVDTTGADANITLTECIDPATSQKSVCLTGVNADWVGVPVNISYTYGPDGYIDSSGGRALATLVLIFAALAIAIVALEPSMRSGVLDMMGR